MADLLEPQHEAHRPPFLARRIADDPGLRQRIRLARTLGVSPRRLEGWEPSTIHEYDDAGRLIRSTPETEWTAEQVGWLAALEEYEAGLCKQCGQPLSETTKPEHDFNNPLSPAFYEAAPGTPVQCHCCAALQRSERDTAALNPQFPSALIHAVRLVRRW
ncbi:hypothetical protein ACIBJE_02050 [Micromonospora sp. NPDC050187]|uniref:hypothetical protein n=1 Tax=Micromonospora sp. NPDC050187 TaxID=3364277 RepID=UPI0037963BB7